MTREELAEKTKKELAAIAKSLGVEGVSRLSREELTENIILLDPPCSANPEANAVISKQLEMSLGKGLDPYAQPPLPEHLLHDATYGAGEEQLPSCYNQTHIVLLVRDPYWLYTYWEVASETKNQLSQKFGGGYQFPLILRVYDITNLDFNGSNSNYYFDVSISHQMNNWYINVGNPNRTFCVDLGFIQADGSFYTIARSNLVSTPRDTVSDIIDEAWQSTDGEFSCLCNFAGINNNNNSSAGLSEGLRNRLQGELSSAGISSLSRPLKLQPQNRQFWLELHTELILYGATEPDAELTVDGKVIPLEPDGSFSLRMALPDGCQRLPVVARSADGIDALTIIPKVTKETH